MMTLNLKQLIEYSRTNLTKYIGSILIIGNYIYIPGKLDPNMIYLFSGFMGGTVGSIFSLAGYLIIYKSFIAQQKQGIELVYFNLLESFNRLRYSALVFKSDGNLHHGLAALIEINKKISLNINDLNAYSSDALTAHIKPYLNEINCYIGALESICNHLASNKIQLKDYFSVYMDQLIVSMSEYERFVVFIYYYSKAIKSNMIIDKITSTPNNVYK